MTSASADLEILLVEDNPADARLVREMLREEGRRVTLTYATRLSEALDFLRTRGFNAVLLDLTLPDSDGLDTFSRAFAEASQAPIVVLTGLADEASAARAVREGAQDYLVKGRVNGPLLYQSIRFAVERHAADNALRRSEARYRNLVEGSIQGIVIHVGGVVQLANAALIELLGFDDASSLVGQSVLPIVADEDRKMIEEYAVAREQGRPAPNHYEFRARRRDGSRIWLDCLVTTILWDDRNATLATMVDITDRKEAEEQVRISEERFRQLADNIKEAFIIVDVPTTQVLYLSRVWSDIWGVSLDDAYANSDAWLEGIHPDDRAAAREDQRVAVSGLPTESVFRVVRPDRSTRWARARMFPVFDDRGAVFRLVGLVEDITDVRNTEEQLRQSQKMESVGRLAGGIAHDFNNLLTAILGFAELVHLRLGDADPSAADVQEIITAGQSAASLTRQLLAFSRRQVLRPAVLNLNDVLRRVESLLRRVIGEDVVLHLVLASDLPSVSADAGQIEQVVMNLAVNARDALPDGGHLTIETALIDLDDAYADAHPGSHSGPHVLIAVTDTGVGMTPDTQQRLFEPFFTTKAVGRGTGLGLSTVHGIVNQSRGSIWVYSEVGRGSTFKIYLPVCTDAPAPKEEPARIATMAGTGTILVVEDQPQVRSITCLALRKSGYSVLEAADGSAALALARAHQGPIDLLLTDVVLPGVSGPRLTDMLRTSRPALRVIFMSGYSSEAIEHHGILESGATFLEKPFTSRGLLQTVRDTMQGPA